jgi:hypothetical protein
MKQRSDSEPQDDEVSPPSAQRVAERAIVLAVVSCRGFLEGEVPKTEDLWNQVRTWFDSLRLEQEVEAWEKDLIDTPLGQLSIQDRARAQWLCEGMVVLAWALGCTPMPAQDESIVAANVARMLGFLRPFENSVLAAPGLLPTTDIKQFADLAFAIHWRRREYHIRPEKMDFLSFSQTAWFGPLPIAESMLIEGDLKTLSVGIHAASEADRHLCLRVAIERQRAANWLIGGDAVYSETDTST